MQASAPETSTVLASSSITSGPDGARGDGAGLEGDADAPWADGVASGADEAGAAGAPFLSSHPVVTRTQQARTDVRRLFMTPLLVLARNAPGTSRLPRRSEDTLVRRG